MCYKDTIELHGHIFNGWYLEKHGHLENRDTSPPILRDSLWEERNVQSIHVVKDKFGTYEKGIKRKFS